MTAAGAIGGTFWGMLIGMIFFNPLLGAAVGAGAISGKLRDIGISNDFMKERKENLTVGTSDKVIDRLKQKSFNGKILQTSLTVDAEDEFLKILEG